MSIVNKLQNVKIQATRNSRINYGISKNESAEIAFKTIGSSNTAGDFGRNINLEKNIAIHPSNVHNFLKGSIKNVWHL